MPSPREQMQWHGPILCILEEAYALCYDCVRIVRAGDDCSRFHLGLPVLRFVPCVRSSLSPSLSFVLCPPFLSFERVLLASHDLASSLSIVSLPCILHLPYPYLARCACRPAAPARVLAHVIRPLACSKRKKSAMPVALVVIPMFLAGSVLGLIGFASQV